MGLPRHRQDWRAFGNDDVLTQPRSRPKLPCSFNSGRWRNGYNPYLIYVSSNLAPMSTKLVLDHIPKSQHRPIRLQLHAVVQPKWTQLRRGFNFKKADWQGFPTPEAYERFVKRVWSHRKDTSLEVATQNMYPAFPQILLQSMPHIRRSMKLTLFLLIL